MNDDLEKDFNGSGRGLVEGLYQHLPGANKKMASASAYRSFPGDTAYTVFLGDVVSLQCRNVNIII